MNEEKILATEGDVIFINSGIFHGGTPRDCIYECIVFDMKLLLKENHACTKLLQDITSSKTRILSKLPTHITQVERCLTTLFESMNSSNLGQEFMIQGSLYHLLGIILEHKLYSPQKKVTFKTTERINAFKKVITLIENNYSETLTLEDLAKVAYMNPKYFCRFFAYMTNKTPIEYLNYFRIESACEKLITTELSITEISMQCGFNDLSYFIKTFKKYKGIPPKQYRNSFG